ncbi:MAG: ShlB/FhaC/HecB family hemolysin secretion/activation protein [Oceanospirillaceae bacterium]|nr:ShlB/FhaC/HecB family hemolysin secretion/activation protein [Oceanospirillaceae bacterium]
MAVISIARLKVFLTGLAALLSISVYGVEVPTAGSILQQLEQRQAREQDAPELPKPDEADIPELPPFNEDASVQIDSLVFSGNAVISDSELEAALKSYSGRKLDYPLMQRLAQEVGEFYRSKGLWAKAILPPQQLADGRLRLQVFEGSLGNVVVEPNLAAGEVLRFPEFAIREFITREQSPDSIFRIDEFESSIKRLDAVPGITAAAILKQGEEINKTDVVVRAANTPMLSGSLRADNFGSRSTGYYGAALSLNLDGLLHIGDQLTLNRSATEGVDVLTLGASIPVSNDGSRVGINYTDMSYQVCCGPLASSGVTGGSQSWAATYSTTLVEAEGRRLSHILTLNHKASESAGAPNRVVFAVAGLEYSWPGSLREKVGLNTLGVKITRGELSIGDSDAQDADAQAGRTDGFYTKLGFNYSLLQPLTETDTLWVSLMGQWAYKNLDSGEKFSLGGPSSIRAYPGGEGSGDSGALLTVELRHTHSQALQSRLFFDQGWLRTNRFPWPPVVATGDEKPNFLKLAGVGAGLTWMPWSGAKIDLNVATRLGTNPLRDPDGKDSDGTSREVRSWLTLTQAF